MGDRSSYNYGLHVGNSKHNEDGEEKLICVQAQALQQFEGASAVTVARRYSILPN